MRPCPKEQYEPAESSYNPLRSMYEALNIEFNSEHRLFITQPEGAVDDHSARELLHFLLALEEVAEPFNRVADLSHATDISLSTTAIREYAERRLQNLADIAPFRAAIITPSPESAAAGNLYATLMKGSKVEVGVFPNTSSAAEWLGVPEAAVRAQPSATRRH
jgi:hypothetical protein